MVAKNVFGPYAHKRTSRISLETKARKGTILETKGD